MARASVGIETKSTSYFSARFYFVSKAEGAGAGEDGSRFQTLVHSPTEHNSQNWAGSKAGAWHCILGSLMGGSLHLGHLQLRYQARYCKTNWDQNQHTCMECCVISALCHDTSPPEHEIRRGGVVDVLSVGGSGLVDTVQSEKSPNQSRQDTRENGWKSIVMEYP